MTWTLTGRAHILGRGHDRVHTRLGRGAVLRHGEVKGIDDGIVRRRQEEEEGGEGEVRAILAFRATVIEVVAGAGVGIEGDGLGRGLNYTLQTLKRESTEMSLALNVRSLWNGIYTESVALGVQEKRVQARSGGRNGL